MNRFSHIYCKLRGGKPVEICLTFDNVLYTHRLMHFGPDVRDLQKLMQCGGCIDRNIRKLLHLKLEYLHT